MGYEYKNEKTENFFMNKQDYYNKYRPNYDKKIINILEEKYGLNTESVIAEYGAGTGKFTDLIIPYIKKVYFIEPNRDMMNLATENIKSSKVVFKNEKAEKTSIPKELVDFAFAVHSFHYFEKDEFKIELEKTLKNDGYFCIIWYDYLDENNPLQVEWQELMYQKKGFSDNHNKKNDRADIYINGLYEEHNFVIKKYFTFEQLLGLGLSVSSTPLPAQTEEYAMFENKVKDIFNKYQKNNKVEFNLKCNMQIGKIK